MAERKTIYLDDAMDAIRKDMHADMDYMSAIICDGIEDVLNSLPSADPEAAIVKVLKMVEEYKAKTGTDEIIIMPKNGMKAWDENGVEYTMQPTCNNLATDTISRQAVKDWLLKWEGYIDKDTIARMQYRVIDIPSTQPEQRWIPCDKGEPDEDMECWVTAKTTDVYRGKFTKRYGERRAKGFITSGGFMWWWNTALAWMPIYEPEPYKER